MAEIGGAPLCSHSCDRSRLVRRGLLRIVGRSFPMQVKVSDAQYVYRPLLGALPGDAPDAPYFINTLPDGSFAGISPTDDGRQFNSPFLGEVTITEESHFDFFSELLG